MPKMRVVLARYRTLAHVEKCKDGRINIIIAELLGLWSKLSFPIQSKQTIKRKILQLLKAEESSRTGCWLSSEDKSFYTTQIASKGTVCSTQTGYIHLSKRMKINSYQAVEKEDVAKENAECEEKEEKKEEEEEEEQNEEEE